MHLSYCPTVCTFVCVCAFLPACTVTFFNGANISLHVYWLIMKNGETVIHPKPPLHCHSAGQVIYKHTNTTVLFPSLKVKSEKWLSGYKNTFKFSLNYLKLFFAFLFFFSPFWFSSCLLFFSLSLTISPFNLHCDSLQGWSSRAVTMNLCALNKINYCYLYPHISERVINAGGLAC